MRRLDSFIRRLQAQRIGLDRACSALGPGLVLEIGLGNGRTCGHLHLGDIRDTLPAFADKFPHRAALVHSDADSGVAAETSALAAFVARHLPAILAPNGLAVADQPMPCEALAELPPPAGIDPGRHFFYRLR